MEQASDAVYDGTRPELHVELADDGDVDGAPCGGDGFECVPWRSAP